MPKWTRNELLRRYPNATESFLNRNATDDFLPYSKPEPAVCDEPSKPWKPWTLEEDGKLAAMIKDGLTLEAIGASIGRTKASVACRANELELTNGRNGVNLETVHRQGIKETVNCSTCGRPFMALEKHSRKFCSVECSTKAAVPLLRERAKSKKLIFEDRICLYCGKSFTPTSKAPNKRHCSMSCSQLNPDVSKRRIESTRANPNAEKTSYANCARGWRIVGGIRFYARSLWEANYARYLNFLREAGQIASWEHEPKTFWFEGIKRGTRSYLPDFRVVMPNGRVEWHEVKGWMDTRSRTQLKRMAKYYPEETLILAEGKKIKSLNQTLGRFVEGWENPKSGRKKSPAKPKNARK